MKKILGLGMVALLVMALVGGGTWAYFNDVETSGENILTAGTLNLGLYNTVNGTQTSSVNGTWTTPSGWKPGDSVNATLYVAGSGTINMTSVNVTFASVLTNGTPATISNGTGTTGTDNLTDMLTATTVTWAGANVTALANKTLGQLIALGSTSLGSGLNAGQEKGLNIIWSFNTSATNGCQGDSVNITATLTGNQN